jgi:hypothetical protein
MKAARRAVEELGGEDIGESMGVVFHPKLLRIGRFLFLSFRTQYINVGKKGAMSAAKKIVREGGLV